MQKNRNKNKSIPLGNDELVNIRKSFAAHGIQTPLQRYRVSVDSKRKRAPRLDLDNIIFKHELDGLVDLEILQDDNFENMPQSPLFNTPTWVSDYGEEQIIITITEV